MVEFGTELGARVYDHSGLEPDLPGELPENTSPHRVLVVFFFFKSPILLMVLTPESKPQHRKSPVLKKSVKNNVLYIKYH